MSDLIKENLIITRRLVPHPTTPLPPAWPKQTCAVHNCMTSWFKYRSCSPFSKSLKSLKVECKSTTLKIILQAAWLNSCKEEKRWRVHLLPEFEQSTRAAVPWPQDIQCYWAWVNNVAPSFVWRKGQNISQRLSHAQPSWKEHLCPRSRLGSTLSTSLSL